MQYKVSEARIKLKISFWFQFIWENCQNLGCQVLHFDVTAPEKILQVFPGHHLATYTDTCSSHACLNATSKKILAAAIKFNALLEETAKPIDVIALHSYFDYACFSQFEELKFIKR